MLTALTFLALEVTRLFAIIQPFSISIIGHHSLMDFISITMVGLHVFG